MNGNEEEQNAHTRFKKNNTMIGTIPIMEMNRIMKFKKIIIITRTYWHITQARHHQGTCLLHTPTICSWAPGRELGQLGAVHYQAA